MYLNIRTSEILGDCNGDRDVDGSDRADFNYYFVIGAPEADLNYDKSVDGDDVGVFVQYYEMVDYAYR